MNISEQRIPEEIFRQQPKQTAGTATNAGVGQDKGAAQGARLSSQQVSRTPTSGRAIPVKNNPDRTHIVNTGRSRREKLTLWVEPVVKSELQRRAERNNLSLSATGGALLDKALQQSIDMEYGALLEPIIRQEIRKQIRGFASRIALLLVRVAFAAEQTRALVTNILGRQPGVEQDVLTNILDSSANAAKGKITRKTPQLQRILAEVEAWFTGPEDMEGGK